MKTKVKLLLKNRLRKQWKESWNRKTSERVKSNDEAFFINSHLDTSVTLKKDAISIEPHAGQVRVCLRSINSEDSKVLWFVFTDAAGAKFKIYAKSEQTDRNDAYKLHPSSIVLLIFESCACEWESDSAQLPLLLCRKFSDSIKNL